MKLRYPDFWVLWYTVIIGFILSLINYYIDLAVFKFSVIITILFIFIQVFCLRIYWHSFDFDAQNHLVFVNCRILCFTFRKRQIPFRESHLLIEKEIDYRYHHLNYCWKLYLCCGSITTEHLRASAGFRPLRLFFFLGVFLAGITFWTLSRWSSVNWDQLIFSTYSDRAADIAVLMLIFVFVSHIIISSGNYRINSGRFLLAMSSFRSRIVKKKKIIENLMRS